MMKRLRIWLRDLSLTQQMTCIIFVFVSVFVLFISLFLLPAVDRFAEAEMLKMIHNSHQNMMAYLTSDPDNEEAYFAKMNDTVASVLYDEKTDSFQVLCGSELKPELEEDVQQKAKQADKQVQDYQLRISGDSNTYMYSMTEIADHVVLVSVMSNEYIQIFRSALTNGVLNTNLVFVSFLFILMLIWVGSLIVALSRIKQYITKIKNGQEAVLHMKRGDEIGEVGNALVEMQTELQKQNAQKEEMIQNISHDLKTPIATIKSYAEAIKDGIYPYETLDKSVDVIIEHADRLEKKVKSLIILNKMDYLKDNLEPGDHLDMNHVIQEVMLSLKVIRPEISFLPDLEENVYFHGEEEPWRIVVENLIDNALRYAKSEIGIKLRPNELIISDDGKHISDDMLMAMFHPYEKGSDGQFGLGLSIVYRIVTTYGYQITAENLEEGVCFRIYRTGRKVKKGK